VQRDNNPGCPAGSKQHRLRRSGEALIELEAGFTSARLLQQPALLLLLLTRPLPSPPPPSRGVTEVSKRLRKIVANVPVWTAIMRTESFVTGNYSSSWNLGRHIHSNKLLSSPPPPSVSLSLSLDPSLPSSVKGCKHRPFARRPHSLSARGSFLPRWLPGLSLPWMARPSRVQQLVPPPNACSLERELLLLGITR